MKHQLMLGCRRRSPGSWGWRSHSKAGSGQSVVQSLYLQGVTERGHMESFTVLSEWWRREVRKQPQEGFGEGNSWHRRHGTVHKYSKLHY